MWTRRVTGAIVQLKSRTSYHGLGLLFERVASVLSLDSPPPPPPLLRSLSLHFSWFLQLAFPSRSIRRSDYFHWPRTFQLKSSLMVSQVAARRNLIATDNEVSASRGCCSRFLENKGKLWRLGDGRYGISRGRSLPRWCHCRSNSLNMANNSFPSLLLLYRRGRCNLNFYSFDFNAYFGSNYIT